MAARTSTLPERRSAALGRLFDRWWWAVAAALVPAAVYLNYDGQGMQGVLPDYVCLRAAIVAGLDPAANHCQSPTFPMWGYGWLLAVTQQKVALLLLQGLAAVAAVWFFLRTLAQLAVLRPGALRLVKLFLVLSVPWYAFNALRWPYSEAVSVLLVSLAVLLLAVRRSDRALPLFAVSGLLFGVVLNFRSDYVALPVLIAAVVIVLARPRRMQLERMAVWLASIVLSLVPWMIYGYRATDHVLVTSTNSGHVLYISLGQLPDNPWGIVASDADPRMHRELDAHFHRAATPSLTYASDQYLRRRFLTLVREHPVAWLEKDAYNLRSTLTGGFYEGEFLQDSSCYPRCWARYGFNADGSKRLTPVWKPLLQSSLSPVERIRYALQGASVVESRLVSVLGFLLAPILLFVGLRRRSLPLSVVALVACFQALINVFAYYLPSYSSNAYVLLLVLIGVAWQWAWTRRAAR